MRPPRIDFPGRRLAAAVATAAILSLGGAPALAAPASTASDICPGDPDPCNVTSSWEITNGAVLDFGTRDVVVSGGGKFDFGTNSGSILCGDFTANTSNASIDANGPSGDGLTTASGSVTVEARRLCSSGGQPVACVGLSDCQLGACDTRRCETRSSRTCTADGDCDLGICGANRRCSGSLTFVRCASNDDCFFGDCLEQVTCRNRSRDPVACATNADCDFGTCSVGSASITLGGSIVANSDAPGAIELAAADNITTTKPINVASSSAESDGGEVTLDATNGSVTIGGKISADGGVLSQGGLVEMFSGLDVVVNADIDVVGGDFDGGSVEIDAGRDALVNKSLLANSGGGAGFGGEITIDTGRHLVVTGASPSNKTTFETNGHTDITNFPGDGGTQELTTEGDLTLGQNTRLISIGSTPDGAGGETFLDSSGNLSLAGDITAKAQSSGEGGFVSVFSSGTAEVTDDGSFDLTGGAGGGGLLEFEALGDTTFAGSADVSGGLAGFGGTTFFDIDADTTLSGTMLVAGTSGGVLEVNACRITMTGTGELDNNTESGENILLVRESMNLMAGSEVTVPGSGVNEIVHRTADKPPVLNGTISPAPDIRIPTNPDTGEETLVGCPVCGNSEVDYSETCDDGNTQDDDGCSSDCQNENCLAQTVEPGYPEVPLCEDNNLCTADVCNTDIGGGVCQHPAKNCSDSFSCTTDSCNAETGDCEHTPNDGLCNDGNVCTDDFCSAETGCFGVANNNPCDDGDDCTTNDTCGSGLCAGTIIPDCGVCGDGSVNAPEECDDGNDTFTPGEYCGVDCVLIPCGKPTNSSGTRPKASDAQFTLKAAVGQETCHVRVCDVDSSGRVLASDAQRILRAAVGQDVTLVCPDE